MYKELIIAFIIIITIVCIDIKTQKYAEKVIKDIKTQLQDIKEDINNSKKNNIKNEESEIEQIYDLWLKHHNKLAYFIEHDELEKVETNLVTAKSFIKTRQYDFANAELEKTIFVLEHIGDKYMLNLENIF